MPIAHWAGIGAVSVEQGSARRGRRSREQRKAGLQPDRPRRKARGSPASGRHVRNRSSMATSGLRGAAQGVWAWMALQGIARQGAWLVQPGTAQGQREHCQEKTKRQRQKFWKGRRMPGSRGPSLPSCIVFRNKQSNPSRSRARHVWVDDAAMPRCHDAIVPRN